MNNYESDILGPHPLKEQNQYLAIVANMTDNQLQERASFLTESLTRIKVQKYTAQVKLENNIPVDLPWLFRLKKAQQLKGLEFAYTTSEINKRNRERNDIRRTVCFEDIAKKYLPNDTFNLLRRMYAIEQEKTV